MPRAHSCIRVVCIVLAIAILAPAIATAQSFVYVNNQDTINSVSAFAVSTTGALTPVLGSPYLTGGVGSTTTCYGLDRMTISTADKLLFVSNSSDQSVSVFQIDASSGTLTATPGSPFASGLALDACGGISLAVTPDGKFLMASSNGQIQSFNIAVNGSLTPAVLTANCCSPTVGMKISADGNLLALSNESSISVYTVNADGSLTVVSGSPFAKQGTGLISGLEFSCAADRLYASEASFSTSSITDAWSVSGTGVLTPIAGSPFLNSGGDTNVVLLSPDNNLLFTSDQFDNTITSFNVAAPGNISRIGAFGSPASIHLPTGLATDAGGQFLFVADDTFGIAALTINADGSLSNPRDIATISGQEMQSVAAYPTRSCSVDDLSLMMTAAPDPVESGSNITYVISITNNGTSPASATITDNLPAGASFVSCSTSGSGSCTRNFGNPHKFTFSAIAGGDTEIATLVAQTSTDLINGSTLTNTAVISNRSVIDPDRTNDSATVSVKITAQPGPTTLALSPTVAPFGSNAIINATLLKKINGIGVSGKSVAFTVNGVPVGTAITNNAGQASLSFNPGSLAIGSYPGAVTASFAGDNVFAASSAVGDLIIAKSVLTVFPQAASRSYGDANPAFTYSLSGFLNGDTAALVSGSATCSTTATATSSVGQYQITCDVSGLSAANYSFTSATALLTVTPAPLTVTADSLTRIYGDPNPVFTGTITGLKNADVVSVNYASTALQTSAAGTYSIVAFVNAGPLAGNYSITVVNGMLTITPAPLTVNVNSATRVYGDPNPAFSGTITGLKNGDVITATYSSLATQASPVGTYLITPLLADPFAKLGNYAVTINNGTLTITAAPLNVTVNSATRQYGTLNPAFSGAITGIKNADAITAAYSTTATIASPVGTYAIVPALADPGAKLGNYAVTIVNGVLTITPAPLTVAINNATRPYGSTNPTLNGSITGLLNGDVITATYSTVGVTSPVGTFPITPAFNDPGVKLGNYTVIATGGVLTITPAPLTVTAGAGSRLYGDPNPAATVSGLVNGDNITASDPTPTASSPVGTYTVTPVVSDPGNKISNYAVTIKTATLTISKAPLTVTAANATRAYGSANPTLTGAISGIKNGDNLTPNPTTTATPSTTAGTAVINAGVNDPSGVLGNYSITATNGTLTITKVALTISANNTTVVLNTSTPGFTATYAGFVNGETPSVLSGTLSCSSSLGTVGSHPITCSGQSSSNYNLTFASGTATVIYAPVGLCGTLPGHQILSPISTAGTTTFTRATTTSIPVQFRVCDAKGSIINGPVISSFTLLQKITAGVTTTLNQAQTASFSFNGTNQDTAATLSTSTPTNLAAGSTYVYQIGLNDGTSISFQFSMN
jgi:6-phosphogluconolactonase (cycloisomerase 2 family)